MQDIKHHAIQFFAAVNKYSLEISAKINSHELEHDDYVAIRHELVYLNQISFNMGKKVEHIENFGALHLQEVDTRIKNIEKFRAEGRTVFPMLLGICEGRDWADESEHDELLAQSVIDVSSRCDLTMTKMKYERITEYDGVKFPAACEFPSVSVINDIPECMYYYEGDYRIPQGLYMRISKNCIARIPWPDVSGSSIVRKSIPCKNIPCAASQKNQCDKTHKGELFMKMGSLQRCTEKNFGRRETFAADVKNVGKVEIRQLMMLSLSDALLCAVWNKIGNDIDSLITDLEKMK